MTSVLILGYISRKLFAIIPLCNSPLRLIRGENNELKKRQFVQTVQRFL